MIRTCNETLLALGSLGATIVEGIDILSAHMPGLHPALYFNIISQAHRYFSSTVRANCLRLRA